MNLIVAVSSEWGIGYKNELLFHIREDLQNFKNLTINKVVVMGYNTFKSLPGRKPLHNRVNIILSRKENLKIPEAIVCGSIGSLETVLKNYEPRDVFIIGGEKIYGQLLSRCKKAYVTKVEASPAADTFFPNLDENENWQLQDESPIKKSGDYLYKFSIYYNSRENI